jgi:hypothetical protein
MRKYSELRISYCAQPQCNTLQKFEIKDMLKGRLLDL